MKRPALTLLAAATMLAVFSSLAGAFTMAEKVVVANELIAIARVPAGGFSADERVNAINDRLAYILGFEPLAPSDIYAVTVAGGSRAIMVGRSMLMTVTTADARANGTSVPALTRIWLENARETLPQARPTPAIPG